MWDNKSQTIMWKCGDKITAALCGFILQIFRCLCMTQHGHHTSNLLPMLKQHTTNVHKAQPVITYHSASHGAH